MLLEWRQIGLLELIDDPQLPYLVEWGCRDTEHPSCGADGTVGIDRLEISGERDTILDWLGTPEVDPLPHVHVDWLELADPALAYEDSGLVPSTSTPPTARYASADGAPADALRSERRRRSAARARRDGQNVRPAETDVDL